MDITQMANGPMKDVHYFNYHRYANYTQEKTLPHTFLKDKIEQELLRIHRGKDSCIIMTRIQLIKVISKVV